MNTLEVILKDSKLNKWPYPKTFEALKNAGVNSYTVTFTNDYNAIFEGSFGTWSEPTPTGYTTPHLSSTFSGPGIQQAIMNHAQGKTSFVQFLIDIAAQGVSHYNVDMNKRIVTYLNEDESCHLQMNVPAWNQ